MILVFSPALPDIPGQEVSVPKDWMRHLAPWSKPVYKLHDFGSSLTQEMINDQFSVFIWTLDIKDEVLLYPVAKKPKITLQFTLAGKKIACQLNGYGPKMLIEGNFEMFYVPVGFHEALFAPGFYESLHIELQSRYLEELIVIRPEINELIQRLLNASVHGMPIGSVYMNYKTLAILKNLRACNKKHASLQLEMHKFILELLSEYFSAMQQQTEEQTNQKFLHGKKMTLIKNNILSAPDIRQHTIENISKTFGISQSVLKRSFKIHFRITVSKFVHQQVMNKAVYLLTTTDKTIDDIADELGYNWRISFEQAFKIYFNYSAFELRHDRIS